MITFWDVSCSRDAIVDHDGLSNHEEFIEFVGFSFRALGGIFVWMALKLKIQIKNGLPFISTILKIPI